MSYSNTFFIYTFLALGQPAQLSSQPTSQPSSPYVASASPNGTSAYPSSEISIQTNPSQLQKQSQTVASITHTQPQLSSLSSPYKTPNTSTQEPQSSTPLSNTTADPHLSTPPPSFPIQHLDSTGLSKSSMNRVVVPDIEQELNFLKYQEVKSPVKLALNNTNNGFIDCFVKFLKVYLILFTLQSIMLLIILNLSGKKYKSSNID